MFTLSDSEKQKCRWKSPVTYSDCALHRNDCVRFNFAIIHCEHALSVPPHPPIHLTFFSPPPALCRVLSREPTLDCAFHSTLCDSIYSPTETSSANIYPHTTGIYIVKVNISLQHRVIRLMKTESVLLWQKFVILTMLKSNLVLFSEWCFCKSLRHLRFLPRPFWKLNPTSCNLFNH